MPGGTRRRSSTSTPENGTYTDAASNVTVQGHARLARFMKVYLGYSPLCTVTFTNVTRGGARLRGRVDLGGK